VRSPPAVLRCTSLLLLGAGQGLPRNPVVPLRCNPSVVAEQQRHVSLRTNSRHCFRPRSRIHTCVIHVGRSLVSDAATAGRGVHFWTFQQGWRSVAAAVLSLPASSAYWIAWMSAVKTHLHLRRF
jgi:hypothetical protein